MGLDNDGLGLFCLIVGIGSYIGYRQYRNYRVHQREIEINDLSVISDDDDSDNLYD